MALLPEVIDVLKVVKKYNLILATGHASAEEDLMLAREARKLGIDRLIVTHAMPPPINMAMGARIGGPRALFSFERRGPAESSDTIGKPGRSTWPTLMKARITVPEIDMMAKRNPARLIGLE